MQSDYPSDYICETVCCHHQSLKSTIKETLQTEWRELWFVLGNTINPNKPIYHILQRANISPMRWTELVPHM